MIYTSPYAGCSVVFALCFTALNVSSESIWSPLEGREKVSERLEGRTALELLKQEQAQNGIVTFSAQIDEMLGKHFLCNSIW